jgi:site-specific DNA-cytosine methylase
MVGTVYAVDGLNQVVNENGIYQSLRTWYDGADCIAVREVANTITSGIYHKSTVVNQDVDRGHLVAYVKARRARDINDYETWETNRPAPTLNVNDNATETRATAIVVEPQYAIRRLTPRECERLQGWPDDHTRWTDKGIEIKDSPRYRMIGNGVSSPVAQWVGENIKKYG